MNKKKRMFALWLVLAAVICLLCWWTARRNAQSVPSALTVQNCTVVIDPGHGGMDGGATAADGTVEKEINLQIAQKLCDLLQCAGVPVRMTRTTDASIHDPQATTIRQQKVSDIHNRLKIMQQDDPSVFVSIHQNHYSAEKYHGTQVFYSGNDPCSALLAGAIQTAVKEKLQPENMRQIKQSGTEIYLLYHAVRPAVMVECGFLSNTQEAQNLKDSGYQFRIALCIYAGILDFFENAEEV